MLKITVDASLSSNHNLNAMASSSRQNSESFSQTQSNSGSAREGLHDDNTIVPPNSSSIDVDVTAAGLLKRLHVSYRRQELSSSQRQWSFNNEDRDTCKIWNLLAKMKTLPEGKAFGWKVCHGALPVGAKLRAAGSGNGIFSLCNDDQETVLHSLKDYPGAKEVLVLSRIRNGEKRSTGLAPDSFFRFLLLLWNFWNRTNVDSPLTRCLTLRMLVGCCADAKWPACPDYSTGVYYQGFKISRLDLPSHYDQNDTDTVGRDVHSSHTVDSELEDESNRATNFFNEHESSIAQLTIDSLDKHPYERCFGNERPVLPRAIFRGEVLVASGRALYDNDMSTLAGLMHGLEKMVSISGEPIQRLGAYVLDGLRARLESSDLPILEVRGTQWMFLIAALAKRPGGPPSIRITGIDDSQSNHARGGGLNIVGQKLSEFAKSCNVPFEFYDTNVTTSEIQLEHFNRETVEIGVKSLSPKVVTLVEQESNTNTSPFFSRYVETLDYYTAMFESIDAACPRDDKKRINAEQDCVARDIVNMIACEGPERVERHELLGKWRSILTMAGFSPYPLSSSVTIAVRDMLKEYEYMTITIDLQREMGLSILGGETELWQPLPHGDT
ncbi:Chitin-inducible gibberellin-responsive protein 1 [Hibiscus syriacus]|uniref:Chitin-inducible gibberellin-responsive protein 1 n=1 Tax=Hibiscus syriacus TaxID=106335 RepID=A0A6A3AZP9_HIBSY|nr:Chitin-inducible gibberellin-responsive protein 1 [Hibiscus syriacus]